MEYYHKVTTKDEFQLLLNRYTRFSEVPDKLSEWDTIMSGEGGCFRVNDGKIAGWNYIHDEECYIQRELPCIPLCTLEDYVNEAQKL